MNPDQISYDPHLLLDLTENMSYAQRFLNVIYHFGDKVQKPNYLRSQQSIYETGFPTSRRFTRFEDKFNYGVSIVRKIKMKTYMFINFLNLLQFFINSHFSINYSKARQPNLVCI